MSEATTRLLSAVASTRLAKSWKSAKAPPAWRASMIFSTTADPTFRTPEIPNTILPSRTVKSSSDALTDGADTSSPIVRHSLRYIRVRSLSRRDDVSRAAMYSAGK